MKSFFNKVISSPFIIFLMLLDLFSNIGKKTYDVLWSKVKISDMLSQIDWAHTYDMVIRIILTILLWWFYKDYVAFKKRKDDEHTALINKRNADYQRFKRKINALNTIMHEADEVLLESIIEGRDRQNISIDLIAKSLNKLGDENIRVRKEDDDVIKYRNKVNKKMDEQQDALYKILDEWDDDL